MTDKNISLSQRENYTPSSFTEFLWWLSTAERELLVDCVVDRNRYRIIGMTVLATWIFASFAWICFFTTVTGQLPVAVVLGLFMGFVILTIDRALIKGITRSGRRKAGPLIFRGILALTIGTFMAQPVVLYMFDKEIRLQTSLDNEQRKKQKQQELETFYKAQQQQLQQQTTAIKKELSDKYDAVSNARNQFIAETDGSGGTGKVGIKDIAIAKRNEYQKLDAEYQLMLKEQQPRLDSTDAALKRIDEAKLAEQAQFAALFNDGFLTRIAALNNMLKSNDALQYRYYLIIFILMLIELMPVIAKSLLPSGTYDEKVALREEMELEIAQSNIRKEMHLKEVYNQLAHENDAELIKAFFALTRDDRTEKIRVFSKKWKEEQHHSFDGFWERMKKEVLTKQEN